MTEPTKARDAAPIREFGPTREQLLSDEATWALAAQFHREAGEPVSAKLAANLSDAARFYRLHAEARGNVGWQA